ncbi:MAG: CRTAC1 family protein [bacterium]|nr:CRTAC1 family protein [bacterium]
MWQLVPPGLENGAEFGSSVGYLGDQDGDGKDEIFVGAPAAGTPTGQPGELFGFNLSESAIDIAAEAAPITAGPTCGASNLLAVHVESPAAVDVFADVSDLGGGAYPVQLFDNGLNGDVTPGDLIYSANVAGALYDTSTKTVEVFARGQAASGGFAIKNVQVPILPSPLVAPYAEYPLSKSSPALPLFAVRVSPCGGAPTQVRMTAPSGFYWGQLNLTDQGPPGDLVAGDGIWSYSGSDTDIILPPPGFYDFIYIVNYPDDILSGTAKFQVIEPTAVSYVNKSSGTGLDYAGQPYSSVAVDFTPGPGAKDLFISMLAERGALYKCSFVSSAGVPHFQSGSSSDTGGELPPVGILGLAAADFNNDGRDDLFVAAQEQGGARLYQAAASGNAVLQNVTSALIPSDALDNSLTGAWGDYDRDGRLDLFVGCGVVTGEPGVDSGTPANGILLRNDTRSGGGFVDVSASTGVGNLAQYAVTATWGDINGDKFPDLFVGDASESGTASRLFRNGKDGGFADEGSTRFGGNLNSVVGACFGDVDADGDLDLTVATRTGAAIRINTSAGTYTSIVPVGAATTVSGVNVFDFDYNGVQDVLLLSADSASTPKLFRGASSGGNLSFADVTSAVGLNWPGKIGGSVLSDFNNDGDLDLYLGRAIAESAHFFTAAGLDPTTDAYTQNWLRVTLTSNLGVPNNYKGIGAKVTATQGANQFVRVVDGGSGRGGQDDSVLIFGLPSSAPVDLVSVAWPNGYVQSISGPISVGTVFNVVDDTQAFSVTQATGGYEIIPCEGVNRWNFTWKTSVGTNPALDRIVYKIDDADLQNGGTMVLATDAGVSHLCTVNAAGAYVHSISYVVPCGADRVVYFAATSAAVTETTSQTRSFAESICSVCDPNQQ